MDDQSDLPAVGVPKNFFNFDPKHVHYVLAKLSTCRNSRYVYYALAFYAVASTEKHPIKLDSEGAVDALHDLLSLLNHDHYEEELSTEAKAANRLQKFMDHQEPSKREKVKEDLLSVFADRIPTNLDEKAFKPPHWKDGGELAYWQEVNALKAESPVTCLAFVVFMHCLSLLAAMEVADEAPREAAEFLHSRTNYLRHLVDVAHTIHGQQNEKKLADQLTKLAQDVFKAKMAADFDGIKPKKELGDLMNPENKVCTVVQQWTLKNKVFGVLPIERHLHIVLLEASAEPHSNFFHRRFGQNTPDLAAENIRHFYLAWGNSPKFMKAAGDNKVTLHTLFHGGAPHSVMLVPSDPFLDGTNTLHLVLMDRLMTITRKTLFLGSDPTVKDIVTIIEEHGRKNMLTDVGLQFLDAQGFKSQDGMKATLQFMKLAYGIDGDLAGQASNAQEEPPVPGLRDVLVEWFKGGALDNDTFVAIMRQEYSNPKRQGEKIIRCTHMMDMLTMLEGRAYNGCLYAHMRSTLKQIPYKVKGYLTLSKIVPMLTGLIIGEVCSLVGAPPVVGTVAKGVASLAFKEANDVSSYKKVVVLKLHSEGNTAGFSVHKFMADNDDVITDMITTLLTQKESDSSITIDKEKQLPLWVTLLKDLVFAAISIAIAVFGAPALPALAPLFPIILKVADFAVSYLLHKIFDPVKKVPMLDHDEGPLFVLYMHADFLEVKQLYNAKDCIDREKQRVQRISYLRTKRSLRHNTTPQVNEEPGTSVDNADVIAMLYDHLKVSVIYSKHLQNPMRSQAKEPKFPEGLAKKERLNAPDIEQLKTWAWEWCGWRALNHIHLPLICHDRPIKDVGRIVAYLEARPSNTQDAFTDLRAIIADKAKHYKEYKLTLTYPNRMFDWKKFQPEAQDSYRGLSIELTFEEALVHKVYDITLASLMMTRLRESGSRIVNTSNVAALNKRLCQCGIVTLRDWMDLQISEVMALDVPIGLRNRFITEGCNHSPLYAKLWEGVEL
eukprot:CAMPEP_0177676466 /NCGR_PEP_ID=MMETSP0447-20121125/27810_1 /TAXON_ID=0 /ORGANISM="Stygamoeba regulata, Strain BSH-02190019" /LENGTH=1002 /DNA_ID=CAMNT_0019185043 /DNA_START=9 /DNA_END=3017 /DNA_ORIENTATION=+